MKPRDGLTGSPPGGIAGGWQSEFLRASRATDGYLHAFDGAKHRHCASDHAAALSVVVELEATECNKRSFVAQFKIAIAIISMT